MATENQVTKQAEKNEKLRQQIAELNAGREQAERDETNSVRLQQLQAEEARLKTELEYAKRLEKAQKASAKTTANETDDAALAPTAVGTTVQTPVDRSSAPTTGSTPANQKGK